MSGINSVKAVNWVRGHLKAKSNMYMSYQHCEAQIPKIRETPKADFSSEPTLALSEHV